MVQKRTVLEHLTRDELISIADAFDVHVQDRRSKEKLVDAVAASRSATLAAVLASYSRDRLKELCRVLHLDDGGREKAVLVARLTGGKASEPPAPPRANGAARAAPEQVELALGEKLTIDRLERHLWSAADILRGSIDSSDYKNFIFGLLFLKRLSDRFHEEVEALKGVPNADPEDRDEHDFFVPKQARWSELQKVASQVGNALNKAASALEDENPQLEGVLAGIDFNDERKLGDAKNRDVVLGRLVQHFSKLSLKNADLSEPDMLGRAYEYLIEKFADDAGKKGGEFYTPRMVVRLIVELLEPRAGLRICDPTAGSGGMLIECAHYLERHGQNPKDLSLYGQEKNLGTWAICKMNMLLHGLPSARIEKGDTIRDPKLRNKEGLMVFDRVIANPPFSLDEWGREVAENDPYRRFPFGVPPKTKGDLAFVQHMIATTDNKTGKVGVVMPHGVLFRGAAEGEIRKGMLEADLVEAVVGLPTNLFYGTGIPAAVLVLNRSKAAGRKKKVLFVEASREFKEGSAQNFLREEDVKKIAVTFKAFKDVDKYARVVGIEEIEKNDFNLNISRYVQTTEAAERVEVAHALQTLRELEKKRGEAEARMNAYLKELGYDA
ncbi:class I SAM-dependent DNA methyltransferase [Sorangium atrum]|uniref:site-specific DNA-methyltransferase (adenine-specific) n=1 Tax=Sorangium atrum TaxID=2995308 RepID=A0ABT5BXU9_9BACT|nr:class I SAM-dependent DNA methyltransferase [Sorangium aterium]MDC0678984.1 class I SAM-dependent DNA methyltransferase [Sorangium aterium]